MTKPISIMFHLISSVLIIGSNAGHLFAKNEQVNNTQKNQFTFSWQFDGSDSLRPRGGSTLGQDVTLETEPDEKWFAINEEGLAKKEQDRRAILAMQGQYRVSFDFIETINFKNPHIPSRPYQSWGTEYVFPVTVTDDFISLQHIMVMYFKNKNGDDDGKVNMEQPMVLKHWRQDWKFQNTALNVFSGFNTWTREKKSPKSVTGKWSQAVYQVDDSPRYQSLGFWVHKSNYSSWKSEETWRPLPRREFSVRNDYDVLVGFNEHIITPNGWVQQEENLKVKLLSPGQRLESNAVVAKELGIARYERIKEHDWSAGEKYWKETNEFWSVVRSTWTRILEENDTVTMKKDGYSDPLFQVMFTFASDSNFTKKLNSDKRTKIRKKILEYVKKNS